MTEVRRLILGTAGHIDHGKTALVRALTGVDTDRLQEEKDRGITIDLGFAEFDLGEASFGVVDVPGHEGFIRNMLAGATGMDVVLLVVAADEGVMPQTREHVDILRMLGVERMVVALTKADLVEDDWLALAREDVRDFLASGPYAAAPIVATSAETGAGLDALKSELKRAAETGRSRAAEDLFRLPVDRVFTVKGTGTVVTGTLWSGRLRDGDTVSLRPGDAEARVRGLQVHGRETAEAVAGQRTAVALAGPGLGRSDVERGATLVGAKSWGATSMLTCRLTVLPESSWEVTHNQRVRVHLGTAEVMARVALLSGEGLAPGEVGWGQLRLEKPLVARGRDRVVLRSYSPIDTIGGAVVVEPDPPKRKSLPERVATRLEALAGEDVGEAVVAALELAGWEGATEERLSLRTGQDPSVVRDELASSAAAREWNGNWFASTVVEVGMRRLLERIERFHQEHPLRMGLPLEEFRQTLPEAEPRTVEALLGELRSEGVIESEEGLVRRAGFRPQLTDEQERRMRAVAKHYAEAGATPPAVPDLPDELGDPQQIWRFLKLLESEGTLVALDDEYFIDAGVLEGLISDVRRELGGRAGLGPSDFREYVPVTRKHLIPILGYFDRLELTVRDAEGRTVLPD